MDDLMGIGGKFHSRFRMSLLSAKFISLDSTIKSTTRVTQCIVRAARKTPSTLSSWSWKYIIVVIQYNNNILVIYGYGNIYNTIREERVFTHNMDQ